MKLIENLVGWTMVGGFLSFALAKEAFRVLDRRMISSEYDVQGHPEFRKKIHHELMKRAEEVQERETGSVFLMQDGKTAVSLGRSKRDDEYGLFSLDMYKLTRFWRDLRVEDCEEIFGKEVQDSLAYKRAYGLLKHRYYSIDFYNNPEISLDNLADPRKIYSQRVTLTVAHEVFRLHSRDCRKEFPHWEDGRTFYSSCEECVEG